MLVASLIGLLFGFLTEVMAASLSLWRYNLRWMPLFNATIVFGGICGSIAYFVPDMVGQFAYGFALGLVYEIANLVALKWWSFPGNRLGPFRGSFLIVTSLSVAWGTVPVSISFLLGFIGAM